MYTKYSIQSQKKTHLKQLFPTGQYFQLIFKKSKKKNSLKSVGGHSLQARRDFFGWAYKFHKLFFITRKISITSFYMNFTSFHSLESNQALRGKRLFQETD